MTEPRAASRRGRALAHCALLFVFLSVVYHSNLRPVASGDSLPAALVPFSILLDHSIALDRFGPYLTRPGSYGLYVAGGRWYSFYPVAGPVLVTPLYLPIAFVPWVGRQSPAALVVIARTAEKFVAVTLASAAAVVLLLLLRRLTSAREAWLLTFVFALGTGNWSTASQALWQHSFGQLAILGCLYAIERSDADDAAPRWDWLAGTCAACALAIRPTNLALLPALGLVLWLRRANLRASVRVFAPLAAAAALTAAYNLAIFDRVTGGYRVKLGWPPFSGLPGILFSPGRGLLVYTPVAIFALAAFASRARAWRERRRLVVAAAGVFSLFHIAFIASWPEWWGGDCWGPRLLTEILAPVTILIAAGLPAIRGSRWKWAFAAAALYGCFIQALGVYCYPKGGWDSLPAHVDARPERLWNWRDNPVIRTARGGVAPEPYSVFAAFARGGWPAAARRRRELGIEPF